MIGAMFQHHNVFFLLSLTHIMVNSSAKVTIVETNYKLEMNPNSSINPSHQTNVLEKIK